MNFVLVIVVLFAVVLLVTAPLRRARQVEPGASAELDHRTGKLSDEDYGALEQDLRAEAIGILREIDQEREHSASENGAAAQTASD